MRIKRVNLISFGKFNYREINFADNLNIISGFNEAGKTTIVDAISGVLFGFKGRREDVKRLKNRYLPRSGDNLYRAGMTIELDRGGEVYLERDFLNNNVQVYNVSSEGLHLSGLTAASVAREHLGVSSLQLFKSTLLIRQEEIAVLADDELSHILSGKMISSDNCASVKTIFHTLGKKYLELNKGLIRNTGSIGPIKQRLEQIRVFEDELGQFDRLATDYDALITEAETINDRIYTLNSRLEAISPSLANFRKHSELVKTRDQLVKQQAEIQSTLDKSASIWKELKSVENYLQEKEPLRTFLTAAAVNEINELEKNRHIQNDRLQTHKTELTRRSAVKTQLAHQLTMETRRKDDLANQGYTLENLIEAEILSGQIMELKQRAAVASGKKPGPSRMFVASGLLFCLLSVVSLGGPYNPGYTLPAIMFAAGLISLILAWMKRGNKESSGLPDYSSGQANSIRQNIERYQKRLAELKGHLDMNQYKNMVYTREETDKKVFTLQKQLAEIDLGQYQVEHDSLFSEYQQIEAALAAKYKLAGVNTYDEYRQIHQKFWEMNKQQEILQDTQHQYLGSENEGDLRHELSILSVKVHNIQTDIDFLGRSISPDQYETLAAEERENQDMLIHLEKELVRVKTGLADFERFALKGKDRWSIESQLRDIRTELRLYDIQKKGLVLAVKLLKEAVNETQTGVIPGVTAKAEEIFGEITNHRYDKIHWDLETNSLTVNTTSKSGNQTVSAGYLSSGTRDQLYLALRVALAHLVSGDKKCPLIFDDPFTYFDPERLQKTIAILGQIAEKQQVILLTKDPWPIDNYGTNATFLTI